MEDFSAIIEIENDKLKNFLENCLLQKNKGDLPIGKFDSKNKTLILDNSYYSLKIIPNNNYQCFLAKRKEKDGSLTVEKAMPFIGKLTEVKEIDLKEDNILSKRTTSILTEEQNLNRLPNSVIKIKDYEETKKSQKMEANEIKEILFDLFTQNPEMYFDEIQKYLDQPSGHLKNILDEICDKRKEKNKFVYNLKEIFLTNLEYDDKKKKIKKNQFNE